MACFMLLFQHLPERMQEIKKQPTTSALLANIWAENQTSDLTITKHEY
jgi:hypothetical protein